MTINIQRDKKREWSVQENTLLKQLYPSYSSKKWKKISQIFKQKCYDRSELEIRQRWTNFLDPRLLFTQWTGQQLQLLYENYKKFGSKWCFIKKTIPGRTENKIKNKFYGNIRIFLRFVVNYFNASKQNTMWIHQINPSVLNEIYKGGQEFSQFGNEMQVAIHEMRYNVDKIRLLSRIERKQDRYKGLYDKIILLYETVENKKLKLSREKKMSTQMSEINFRSNPLNEEDEEDNLKQSVSEQNSEKPEIIPVVQQRNSPNFQFQNIQSQSLPNILELYNFNYPLLNLSNTYPFYNFWFYNN